MRQKIIFIHLLNDYSGSPKVLSQVLEAVKHHGRSEVELYMGKGGEGFLSNITGSHYTYFYKRFENKYLTLFTFMASQFMLFLKLLKYREEDVCIYVNTMLPFGAGLAGFFMGKSVIYHVHETNLQPEGFKKFLRFIIAKTASQIVFVSESLKSMEPFKGLKQTVVHNALPDVLAQKGKTHKYEWKLDGYFRVLMVSSMKGYKGIKELISIASKCLQRDEINFTLVLNAGEREINSYFHNMTIPDNLKIIHKTEDVTLFYQDASLLLNLSRVDQWIETFGLTILEAMSFGIPVIAPPVGGPSEIVTDGKDGFLIDSRATHEVASKVIELSQNESLCQELSKMARVRSEAFGSDRFEENILTVIGNV